MTPVIHPHVHELRYSAALIRRAVRCFVGWRLIGGAGRLAVATTALVIVAAMLAADAAWEWAASFVTVAAAPWLLAVAGWVAHLRSKLNTLRAMGTRTATVSIVDDELRFRSGAGDGTLALTAVTAWRERPDFWLLLTAPNRFTILPTAGLPVELLDALSARLEKIDPRRRS